MGVSKMGCTQPISIPLKTRINGSFYKDMFEQQYYPQMSAIAHVAGKANAWYFQQDNATAHATKEVLASIKKRTKKTFLNWPAASPDLSVLDYFAWNEIKRRIETMDTPPQTEAQLRTAVCLAAASISQDKINMAIDNLIKGREKCIEVGG